MTGKFKVGIRVLSVILTALFLIEILPNKVFAQELNEYLAFNAAAGIEVIEEGICLYHRHIRYGY